MKRIPAALVFILFCIALNIPGYGQCNKNLVLISSKTEYLDDAGTVQRTVDEKTRIEIGSGSISVSPGGDHAMKGSILSAKCAWTKPFEDGKSQFKTAFADEGNNKSVTITLEGKSGKVSFLMVVENEPGRRIRVWADSFREKK